MSSNCSVLVRSASLLQITHAAHPKPTAHTHASAREGANGTAGPTQQEWAHLDERDANDRAIAIDAVGVAKEVYEQQLLVRDAIEEE